MSDIYGIYGVSGQQALSSMPALEESSVPTVNTSYHHARCSGRPADSANKSVMLRYRVAESEVFGWSRSRNLKSTRSRSRNF